MSQIQQSPNALSEEDRFYCAIGRFIFEFSQLEYSIRHYVANAISLREQYFNSIMTHDFALLCNIARSVFSQQLSAAQAQNLKKLLSNCLSLNDDRNKVAHGLWVISRDGGRLHYVSRGKFEASSYFHEVDGLIRKADFARDLRFELERILFATPEFATTRTRKGMGRVPPTKAERPSPRAPARRQTST